MKLDDLFDERIDAVHAARRSDYDLVRTALLYSFPDRLFDAGDNIPAKDGVSRIIAILQPLVILEKSCSPDCRAGLLAQASFHNGACEPRIVIGRAGVAPRGEDQGMSEDQSFLNQIIDHRI
jgi:hypothetical protein